jgi:hypothetical protein
MKSKDAMRKEKEKNAEVKILDVDDLEYLKDGLEEVDEDFDNMYNDNDLDLGVGDLDDPYVNLDP